METLIRHRIIHRERAVLIKGSGVDLNHFQRFPTPKCLPTVAIVSRMLWNKGIGELVEAARILRARGRRVRILLIGMPDPENPSSISDEQLCNWHDDGLVQWRGYRDDIPAVWREAHIAVLPSYREGLPKSLLEAAACGRPIIATNVPGCREIVEHNRNGLLVPIQDAVALADALQTLLDDPVLCERMGTESRRMAETRFGQETIIDQTLRVYDSLLGTEFEATRPADNAATTADAGAL